MSEISRRLSALKGHWGKERISFSAWVEEAEILAFEQAQGVHLPDDLRQYFRLFDGCEDFYFRFVRLAELEPPSAIPRQGDISHYDLSKREFVIVDYMQYCWWYTIDLSDPKGLETPVGISGTLNNQVIAHSFTEFLDLYLSDDRILYPHKAGV